MVSTVGGRRTPEICNYQDSTEGKTSDAHKLIKYIPC